MSFIDGITYLFQKMNGQEDVSINNAIARRATLKEKKSGGTRIHSFPFRTVFSEDVNLSMQYMKSVISRMNYSVMQIMTRQNISHIAPGHIHSHRKD